MGVERVGMIAMPSDDPRTWARRDPSILAPQRGHARQMRKSPTDAERKLWFHLRHRLQLADTHFRRQVQIGPYIVDFACHHSKLIIEVDGGQHATDTRDAARDRWLAEHRYRVLRFWNNDVLRNTDGVLETIAQILDGESPPRSER